MKHRREGLLDDGLVLPVQIPGSQRAARVAHDHSVRIQHWNNLEQVLLRRRTVTCKDLAYNLMDLYFSLVVKLLYIFTAKI